ncbi:MAG TPA: SGNH/GDSL hydrolase family protein [Planctomycetaceae bacterium]|nr:SGNH/GDSL hydrolase family protein [Planctomycetaceae bacterium]
MLLLLLLEGACSVAIVCKHAFFDQPLAERVHTEYDPELGWINLPSVSEPDMYGPGLALHTNAQRFRQTEDLSKEVPEGKLRVIVSGDSFALGYGVGDDDTWCAQLAANNPKLEVVNMGQGGYGLDQAWLWYKRVRDEFDHDLHLFTFITHDFGRMPHRNFTGYGKPVLTVQKGELVVQNTPVPKLPYHLSKLARNGIEFQQLSTFRVARRLFAPAESPPEAENSLQQTRDVTAAIARELQAYHNDKGSLLVFVHLPTNSPGEDTTWNEFLQAESQRDGWNYLDLTQDFKQLSAEEREKLILKPGDVDYLGAAGHYNAAGNAYIAELLQRRLLEIDEFAEKIQQLEQP